VDSDLGYKNDEIIENLHLTMKGYEFNLRGIPVNIKIRFDKKKRDGAVTFSQSHFIHTPAQADPYRTSRPWGHTEKDALDVALNGYKRFYRMAIEAGHKPDESWLVSNSHFNWL